MRTESEPTELNVERFFSTQSRQDAKAQRGGDRKMERGIYAASSCHSQGFSECFELARRRTVKRRERRAPFIAPLRLCAFGLIFVPLCLCAATNDLTGALQRGLFEEEANRNLDAAAQAYQAVSARFDQDRKLAATAIFRLGEVYRKQGRTNEAVAQYERIVREFPEEQTLATLSRQNLAGLGRGGSELTPEVQQRILVSLEHKKAEIAGLEKWLNFVDSLDREKLRAAYQNGAPQSDHELDYLLRQGTEKRKNLDEVRERLGPQNAQVVKLQGELEKLTKEIDNRIASNLAGFRMKLDASRAEVAMLNRVVGPGQESKPSLTDRILGGEDTRAGTVADLEKEFALLKAQMEQARKETNLWVVAELCNDWRLREALTALSSMQSELKWKRANSPEDSQNIRTLEENVKNLETSVATSLQRLLSFQQARLNVLQSALKEVGAGQKLTSGGNSEKVPAVASTDDEEKEIRRIQEIIKNSPDLINAPVASENGNLTPLCRAAGAGWLRVAKFLLDGSAAIDRRSVSSTPLHYAVIGGHRAMTDFLLERGADVNARDGSGRTPLHVAAENGFQAVAEVLVAHKADINPVTGKGETPLHFAARRGHAELVKYLISKGTNLDAKDENGQTAVLWAAERGHSETVAALLAAKANPDLEDKSGRTPLSSAAWEGHLDSVKALLTAKADPNAGRLSLPLHVAIHRKSPAVIEALLRAGADANRSAAIGWTFQVNNRPYGPNRGYYNLTPLFLAINEIKSAEAVRLLLQHKVEPNAVDPDGAPLIFSALDQPEILKLLLEAGAKPNIEIKDRPGPAIIPARTTPLHAAFSAEAVKLLLTHGANIEARWDGMTPLLAAVQSRNKEKVEALLQGGADLNGKTREDFTALHLAVVYENADIVSILLAHKADVNARDKDGFTPLDLAKRGGSSTLANIAERLRQHGGLSDLPKLDRVTVKRPGTSFSMWLFPKGTNDWNRFTLLDALFGLYGPNDTPAPLARIGGSAPTFAERIAAIQASGPRNDLPFPDLHRIVVVRSGETPTKTPQRINVDLLLPTGAIDCAKDIPLEFGDVVEILEREHTLQELPMGLTTEELQQIAKCREGKVGLLVRGKRTELQVLPSKGSAIIWSVLQRQEVRSALFSSSDLSRLKVTRRDPASGKQREWIVDCSEGKSPDLWLRDGDVIEVPDKP